MGARVAVFDFGKVIVDWDPARAVAHLFETRDEARTALERMGFGSWNVEQDRGRPWEDGFLAAPDERAREVFRAYRDRIDVAHEPAVPGTAALIERLHAEGVPLYGLTNGTALSAAATRRHHPVVAHMRDVVVSAEQGVMKPERAIYDILLSRIGRPAREVAFVDDVAANVEGARAAGMRGHRFTGAAGLEAFLLDEGLLRAEAP